METTGFTMVEINKAATSRKTAIAIRTFFDSNSSNMGLEIMNKYCLMELNIMSN
jgi:hypothetical protein